MRGCRSKISQRCGPPTFAKCVTYEGILHQNTSLDEDDCLNVEQVIEDISEELDKINDLLDMSSLGQNCIEYCPGPLTLIDVLLKYEKILCELIQAENDDTCVNCESPCTDGDSEDSGMM